MSAYSRLKVADLRNECEAHGLDYKVLRKQELIELLHIEMMRMER